MASQAVGRNNAGGDGAWNRSSQKELLLTPPPAAKCRPPAASPPARHRAPARLSASPPPPARLRPATPAPDRFLGLAGPCTEGRVCGGFWPSKLREFWRWGTWAGGRPSRKRVRKSGGPMCVYLGDGFVVA